MTAETEDRIAFARRWADAAPFYRSVGITIAAIEEGRAELRLAAGGVLPSLADAAMGCALRTLHGAAAQILTVESNLRYIRPAAAGEIAAFGRIVQAHRSVAFTEVDIVDADGHLLARGGGTFVIRMNE